MKKPVGWKVSLPYDVLVHLLERWRLSTSGIWMFLGKSWQLPFAGWLSWLVGWVGWLSWLRWLVGWDGCVNQSEMSWLVEVGRFSPHHFRGEQWNILLTEELWQRTWIIYHHFAQRFCASKLLWPAFFRQTVCTRNKPWKPWFRV